MANPRFAIVGCGRIAQRHAEHIANYGKLVGVCDIIEERAQALGDRYSCPVYSRLDHMLESSSDIDVVSVCTPNAFHAHHSIEALRAGKHVICEKPMALRTVDCVRMIETAHESGRILFIVKQNRYNPPIVALRKAISDGWLGDIVNVQLNCFWNRNKEYYLSSDWKGKLDLDGGTLFTQFSHFIDLILWLVGDVERVHGITKNLMHQNIIEFEDTGAIILEFNNGAVGTVNYTVNSCRKNMEGSITLFGKKGTVKVGGQYLNVLEYQSIEGHEIPGLPESRPANEYGFYQGSMSNHDKVYENVIEVLQKGGRITTTAEEGMKTVQLIEMIYQETHRRTG